MLSFFFLMSLRPHISTRTDTLVPYTTLFRRQQVFHVEQDRAGFAESPDAVRSQLPERVVGDRDDDRIVAAGCGLCDHVDAIFLMRGFRVHPGVVDVHRRVIALELAHDVDHAGVAEDRKSTRLTPVTN